MIPSANVVRKEYENPLDVWWRCYILSATKPLSWKLILIQKTCSTSCFFAVLIWGKTSCEKPDEQRSAPEKSNWNSQWRLADLIRIQLMTLLHLIWLITSSVCPFWFSGHSRCWRTKHIGNNLEKICLSIWAKKTFLMVSCTWCYPETFILQIS